MHRRTTMIDYDVEEWLVHGGPTDEAAGEIRSLFEESLSLDLCGLNVRREDDRLRFTHNAAAFLLATPVS